MWFSDDFDEVDEKWFDLIPYDLTLCNCPHRSIIKKCSLAIKNRDFPYLHNFFFEIFLLRSVDSAILVHLHPVW